MKIVDTNAIKVCKLEINDKNIELLEQELKNDK